MDAMDADYSLGLIRFSVKYNQDFPTETDKEFEEAYNKYKDFYDKYHSDNPAATTNCYEEFIKTLGKQASK